MAPSRFLTPVSTLAGFTFALLHAGQREGWTRALRLLALVLAVSLLFESVGVATGLVYGPYHYTNRLGPLFHGLYLFFERLTMLRGPWRLPDEWPKWRQVFSALVVFGLAALARIPFRMDLVTGWHFLARMLSPHAWTLPHLWLVQAGQYRDQGCDFLERVCIPRYACAPDTHTRILAGLEAVPA
ncbi:MAG: carotenoid biosynthesis protein [Chloroflexi bacterium]|nr:carotenoid biosynthesis protein [Chloroflexota bacterium]